MHCPEKEGQNPTIRYVLSSERDMDRCIREEKFYRQHFENYAIKVNVLDYKNIVTILHISKKYKINKNVGFVFLTLRVMAYFILIDLEYSFMQNVNFLL